MPSFGRRSKEKLDTLDPRLQKILNEAIKHFDFTILEGHRGQERQDELYATGKSQLKWPNSKHNSNPSIAVDIAPWFPTQPHVQWDNWDMWFHFAGFIMGVASTLGYKLRWGGNWDGDMDFKDSSFIDAPHFELVD